MRSVDIAVADGDPVSLRRCVEGLSAMQGVRVVMSTADGGELVRALSRIHMDVVVTELTLRGLDGLGVLEAIGMMPGEHPKAMVFSQMSRDIIVNLAFRLGADYYLVKPADCDVLYRRICQLAEMTPAKENPDADMHDVCSAMLSMGISPFLKGHRYLLTGCRLCTEDRSLLDNLTAGLYADIAHSADTTALSVERAIRTAIQSAWKNGGFLRYAAENDLPSYARERPSAGKLLAHLTDVALRQRMH